MVNSVIRKRFADKKPGTIVCNFLTPLTAVLHHAANQGWWDIPRPFTRPKFNDKRERWATPEEADGLLQHAGPHLRPLLLFLMLTGCRVAEAIALQYRIVCGRKSRGTRRAIWVPGMPMCRGPTL
jgi:integrase